MTLKGRLLLTLPLYAALVIGCSKGNPNAPATVTGKVTYNGAPVTGGMVVFHPKEGGMYTAAISPEGTYSVSDLPIGDATVTVDTESINPNAKMPEYKGGNSGPGGGVGKAMYSQMMGGTKGSKGAPGGQSHKAEKMSPMPEGANKAGGGTYVKIPEKYKDPEKSGLTTTLKRGSQTYDIELKD